MLQGFKTFILRGNLIDLAVGVIVGAAFSAIVDSLVKDIITPIIGLIGGQPDFSALRIAANTDGSGGIAVGNFINAVVSFFIKAAVVYFAIVLPVNRFFRRSKSGAATPNTPEPSNEEKLLCEIRDLLARSLSQGEK